MAKREGCVTASELLKRLSPDDARATRHALRAQAISAELEPLLVSIRLLGLNANSLESLVSEHAPLSDDVVQLLLGALPNLRHPRAQEAVVRALVAAAEPFDGEKLTDCFQRSGDEGVRWAIVNTVAVTKPHGIDRWMQSLAGTGWIEAIKSLKYQK